MKLAVAGAGYVGMSLAVLLAQHNEVTVVDIAQGKVDAINNRRSPIEDDLVTEFLNNKALHITATLDKEAAYCDAELVVIATPTDYNPEQEFFNTASVEIVAETVD